MTLCISLAQCFFIILTAEMVNDLNDNRHKKPKLALKGSKSSVTHSTDNPLDESSNSDDPINNTHNTTGFISPPPFKKTRPTRLNKMTRLKFLLKRKQIFHHKSNHNTSTLHPSTVQKPTLSNYSTVNTNPNYYHIDDNSVKNDNESPVKIYSQTNYFLTPPSF